MWDRADHDLEEVVHRFEDFVRQNGIPWRSV
jgi:hypothetical protein